MKLERILMVTTAALLVGGAVAWAMSAEPGLPTASLWLWRAAAVIWSLPLLGGLIYFASRLGRKDDA